MMLCKMVIVTLNLQVIFGIGGIIKFPPHNILSLYSVCQTKLSEEYNDLGICTRISECFLIDFQISNSNYSHTVCGYEGTEQIVCCPWQSIHTTELIKEVQPDIGFTEIDMDTDSKCIIKSSGQNGVLKCIDDCPELCNDIKAGEQDFCNHELCSGIVCCPLPLVTQRYNAVCAKVDRIDAEIDYRITVNTPCSVKGLNNVTGTYQPECDAYTRNDISSENVIVLCKDGYCVNYYCCPVLDPNDRKYCTRRGKAQFPRVQFIGPTCIDSLTNLPGRCRAFSDCPATLNGRKELDECGKDCCTEFYCCPEEDYAFSSISSQKCFGYKNAVYRKQVIIEKLYDMESNNTICSTQYQPHAGGIEAKPGALPHMAALGYTEGDTSKLLWYCGGSLISENYVLTAAHCLDTRLYGQVKIIRLGSLYLDNVTKSDECAEDFTVKRVIPHPTYNRLYVYNDIGLIELDREVKFNYHMRPICLPTSSEVPYGLIGMGWGLLGPGGEKSETLYYGYLDTYTYDECNKSYAFNLNRRSLNGIDDNTQLCVGSRETISSSCTGDSGGPIISKHDDFYEMYYIHGITSFGTVCGFADSPGVYIRVYPYLKWIESVVWS